MTTITYDDSQVFTSGSQPEPDIVCLHTTEGMGWPGYANGGEAPHRTARRVAPGVFVIRRHIALGNYAKALMNLPGGVETNRRGVIQYELIGTCDPKHRNDPAWFYWPDATDEDLKALADELRPLMVQYGIPFAAPSFKAYPSSYGANGVRLSFAEWNAFHGILGHQHVPENSHGDPGNFPIERLLKFLIEGTDSKITKVVRKVTKVVKRQAIAVDGAMGPKTIGQWQKVMGTYVDNKISRPSALVRAVQARVGVPAKDRDGYLGPQTWRYIQRYLGVPQDGIPGFITISALQRRLNTGRF